jgi:MFS family permease
MLATVTAGYVVAGVFTIVFAPILGIVAREFGISVGQITVVAIATYTFTAAVAIIVSGPILDRFGIRLPLVAGAALLVISLALVPYLSHSLTGIVVLRVLAGLGVGPVSACVSAVAARWFPAEEQGVFTGAQGAGMALGVAVGLLAMPAALARCHGDWRAAMTWLVIAPVVCLALSLGTLARRDPPMGPAEGLVEGGTSLDQFRLALHQPAFYIGIASMFVFAWIMQAFNALTPTYLASDGPLGLGFGPMRAGQFMSAVQVGMVLGAMACGLLMEKVFGGSARPVVMIGLLLAGVFMVSVKVHFVNSNPAVLALCLFLAGFFESFVVPCVSAFISRHYPPATLGRVFGLSFGISLFGGSVGVAVGGILLHYTESYRWPIVLVGLIALLGSVASGLLRPPSVFGSSVGAAMAGRDV